MKNRIHNKLLEKHTDLSDWFANKMNGAYVPFYSSYDIRDACFKIGNVDGNIFPAGFNNICQMDKDSAPELIQTYMKKYYPDVKKLLLLTEDHLKNAYYWENAITIKELLQESGFEVAIGMLSDEIDEQVTLQSFSGKEVTVCKVRSEDGQLVSCAGVPDLVISNNDFSNAYENVDFSQTLMTPLRELGWYQRKKHRYFEYYNQAVSEFASIIDEDPWLFQVQTQLFDQFDVSDDTSRGELAAAVDGFLQDLRDKYKDHDVKHDPYVFVKNNSGTYGLGVMTASSGEDVQSWNYKSKKKMKAAKGGGGFDQVIIQEGIPSVLSYESAAAEPALYMVGQELAGGFLRTHQKKDSKESLNSPGAVYKRLCLSDLKVKAEGSLLENVYGWVAKLGLIAISEEAARLK